jgi:8-amino-7-oxononanoate synthase
VVVNGKRVIMIGSNNYLGLTNHPRVKEAAIKPLKNTVPAVRVHDF